MRCNLEGVAVHGKGFLKQAAAFVDCALSVKAKRFHEQTVQTVLEVQVFIKNQKIRQRDCKVVDGNVILWALP